MGEIFQFPENAKKLFPGKSFRTKHGLSDHPLLQLEALVALAQKMDRDRIEYSSGDTSPDQKFEDIKQIDLAPAEVIRQIETCGAWMVLKNVELIPEYRQLIEAALDSGARAAGFKDRHDAGMLEEQGFIFVSSANSTTPFHSDYEENLFVHLHGKKYFHVFENKNRDVVSEEELEHNPAKHRNHPYDNKFEKQAVVYELDRGEGIFLPYIWPHWVKTGDDYSISMAITWKTKEVHENYKLLFMNGMLRRMGLAQSPPGKHPIWDRTKVGAYTLSRALVEPLRKSEASRKFLRRLLFGRKANYYYGKDAEV